MERIDFNKDWKFYKGKNGTFMGLTGGMGMLMHDNSFSNHVELPHDFSISSERNPKAPGGSSTGYYEGDWGYYMKQYQVPIEWNGDRILLEFDGSYMNTEVYVNTTRVAFHPYGYTAFHVDITDCLEYGDTNDIIVIVNNSTIPNSRWYSGSGIFRKVSLLHGSSVHIEPWGIYAYTEKTVQQDATVVVEVTVTNNSNHLVNTRTGVKLIDKFDKVVGTGETVISLKRGQKNTGFVRIIIENAQIWDVDNPDLYTVKVELIDGKTIFDESSIQFGIRMISVDAKYGFCLNGKTLKLKGGCIHHDNGILGAAAYEDAEYRKVKLHKENGYNALRMAHNPPSNSLLDACDKLGVLVIDEAFDMWRMGKNQNDYHIYFDDWWERDIQSMVLRDRNHPSVIMWSVGNENLERDGSSNGYQISSDLAQSIRKLDKTRPVTAALIGGAITTRKELNKLVSSKKEDDKLAVGLPAQFLVNQVKQEDIVWALATEPFAAPFDVLGYNYLHTRYEKDHSFFPNRVMCGTESIAQEIDIIWEMVERLPYVIGDFTWTSYDHLGEAGIGKVVNTEENRVLTMEETFTSPYPWRTSNCADFDLCGNPRPQLYYRQIVWGSKRTYVAVENPRSYGSRKLVTNWGWNDVSHSWTWHGYEGERIGIDVYSAADEVKLFINGNEIGTEPVGRKHRFTAHFDTQYIPGTLEAVSYVENKEVSRDIVMTAGKPKAIVLKAERDRIQAGSQQLCYINAGIVDKDMVLVPGLQVEMSAKVNGAGSLIAFGSANPCSEGNYTVGEYTTYDSKIQAILKGGEKSGKLKLVVSTKEFGEAEIEIDVV